MKLVIMALLLGVAWALPPQPGAKASKQVKQQANDSEHVGKPLAAEPVLPPSPDTANTDSASKADTDKERPVRIAGPVAITTKTDYPTLIFSVLLVVVGFLQTWLLFGTLKATRDNAEAAKDNAAAARLNAEVLMEGSAAHLALAPINMAEIRAGVIPQVDIGLLNKGATPAIACVVSTWIEVLPFPFVDFTETAVFLEISRVYNH